MVLDSTAFAPAFKELYTPNKLQELVLTDRPLMAICPKDEDFFGSHTNQATLYGNPQNASATFATGQALTTTSSLSAFIVTRAPYYSFATIDNQTLKAAANDEGAFIDALELETDGAINICVNRIAQQMYRGGWGDVGVIGSINSTVITLADASTAFNFEKGMNIVFAANQFTAALNSATAVSVTAVNRGLGQITISGTTGTPAAGNYIFVSGDRGAGSSPARLVLTGLGGWVPSVAPSNGESFFAIDRSVDSRLYGNAIDGTQKPLEEAFLDGIRTSVQNGGSPDYILCNPVQYTALEKALGSKVQYIDLEIPETSIGFRGIQIQGPKNPVKVLQDGWCPGTSAFVVETKNMLLHSLGAVPHIFDTDGNMNLRNVSLDAVDVRITSYAQLRVLQPSHFCNITLSAA